MDCVLRATCGNGSAGSVASACVLLVLIALAVWCCCARQKRQKKLVHSQKALQKPGVEGGGVDGAPPPAAVKAASVGDQNQTSLRAAAVSGDGEDGCSMVCCLCLVCVEEQQAAFCHSDGTCTA